MIINSQNTRTIPSHLRDSQYIQSHSIHLVYHIVDLPFLKHRSNIPGGNSPGLFLPFPSQFLFIIASSSRMTVRFDLWHIEIPTERGYLPIALTPLTTFLLFVLIGLSGHDVQHRPLLSRASLAYATSVARFPGTTTWR